MINGQVYFGVVEEKTPNVDSDIKIEKNWKRIEHIQFIKGLKHYGRDYISIQKIVQTRSITQVKNYSQKFSTNLGMKNIRFDDFFNDLNFNRLNEYSNKELNYEEK